MVRRASSPASPVTITVTDAVASVGSRSAGLTSPIPRYSLSGSQAHQRSPAADADQGILRYTVHIPPTPDRQLSPSAEPARSYISGTIFTGGLNCATRAHVVDCSGERSSLGSPRPGRCRNRGCDGAEFTRNTKPPCDCGYSICQDCYTDRLGSGGVCPGCKEPYRDASDEEEEEEDAAPLPMAEMRPKRRLSIMKSTKANNNGDFDHSRWLFETKGTYGYGNAVWPKDGYGGGGDQDPPNFAEMSRRPLTRKVGVSSAILSPYRLLVLIRLVALGFFLAWRVVHPNREAMWLWGMSVTCEFWFAISWLLDQLPKLSPVNRSTDLSVLKDRFESPSARNPKGRSDLPGIDVFVSTADPEKEPPLVTANTILSILAVDYPVEKLACYLSDDGASLLTFEALAETASFAATWVPFCRKHAVEPRNPEAYFALKRRDAIKNKLRLDFVRDRRRVKREYDEFKVRINSLPDAIRRCSDALNACKELRARAQQEAAAPAATWMADGSHWPGAWGGSAAADHTRGDHAGIIQAMLAPPAAEPATDGRSGDVIDASGVDARLPMLVYVSREKRPGYDHNKKAGAMNALVRTSAVMSNGPFILNLDCDHYVHNSHALRDGICFMLDRGGDRVCFVQFPQRFEGIDPNDRYANHNSVFFDVSMRALDGLQGPMYVGTGCIFRRTALYGFPPPRATERSGFLGRRKLKLPHLHLRVLRRLPGLIAKKPQEDPADAVAVEDDDEVESLLLPRTFGSSAMLAASIPVAEYQGRLLGAQEGRRPAGALAGPREPLDAATVAEAVAVISCFYEEKTEWGRRVGWIYGSVTEDVVTGYRMHNRGWRSVYCVTRRDAFRGTAPINLTDRLHQVLRWATGSVEIFFSRNNALFASRRMKLLQRVAYFNVAVYPFTSVFLLVYCFLPALSLLSGQFIVQSLSAAFLAFLLAITATLCLLAVLEVRWSGITLHDWWRNEQFWVIGGTSAHPAAVLQGLLKVVAGVDVSFTLTSKPAAGEGDGEGDSFSELYEVRWSFLMVMPITIMMVNAVAIAVGVARTAYSEFPQWSRLAGGVFFSFWVLCHLYPFAKGLMGRRGKVPTVVFVWSGLLSSIISLLWVYISPPSGRRDYMSFRFP